MSSELQLDVRHLNRWRRHLVNAYEVKAGMVFIAGKTVWAMPECFKVVCIRCKALYNCSDLPLPYSCLRHIIRSDVDARVNYYSRAYLLAAHMRVLTTTTHCVCSMALTCRP